MRRSATFGVGGGIGPNMPAIWIYGTSGRGKVFAYTMTWLGAYFGAWWRNLLGHHYTPISPEKRRDILMARRLP